MDIGDILTSTDKNYSYTNIILYKHPDSTMLVLNSNGKIYKDANDCLMFDTEIVLSINTKEQQ